MAEVESAGKEGLQGDKPFSYRREYGLTSQLRRASVSVSSNIAEGSTRWGKEIRLDFMKLRMVALLK